MINSLLLTIVWCRNSLLIFARHLVSVCDKHPVNDPLKVCFKQLTSAGGSYVLQCALGSRFNPVSCECDIPFVGESAVL